MDIDKIIQLVMVLFILSMIFERINEFIKQYFSCKKLFFTNWFLTGDTMTKFPSGSTEEKRREYRILKMNLFIGFVTSFLAHASFFDLLRNMDDPGKVIGWPSDLTDVFSGENKFRVAFQFTLGCLFTGAFISMGSKFWHDLLDILLQAKNYKRKLNDIKDIEINSISEADTFIAANDATNLDTFLEAYFQKFKIAHFVSHYDTKTVDVYPLTGNSTDAIPKFIPFKAFKRVEMITVVLHEDPEFETQQGPITPASKLTNTANDININFGSLGLFVWNFNKTTRHFLTCYHVVWKNHDWEFFRPNGADTATDTLGNTSTILKAFRNTEVDVALLAPPPGVQLAQQLPPFLQENSIIISRSVSSDDKLKKTGVKINGVKSGIRSGKIIDIGSTVSGIKYPDGKMWDMTNMIVVESDDGKAFSQGGDSGSIVFDEQNIVIGMLIAGSSKTKQSVIIPFSSIENQLLIKL